ncbi:ATP-binding protein [Aliiglaciecola sp. CAU 1673]|uniref:sensor histidine kinase n=1 Tax=Aliiglaciecola sp. CAU 1673 TaxID=3032595 RepID=UPI0023DC6EC4|nr:ATP-binding protein [Aliiglaciecola sp. CAU 1673]MDF2179281.1 ATP-binding protein [Aliiglaciecola sp. CAU 1673]
MKLRTKFTLLVAGCTLLLLGIYYAISVRSANHALVDFGRQSAAVFAEVQLSDDQVSEILASSNDDATINKLAQTLFKQFPEHFFLVLNNGQLVDENVAEMDARVTLESIDRGYQFVVTSPKLSPSIVQMNHPQLQFSAQEQKYDLFWFPKITLTRYQGQETLRQDLHRSFLYSLLPLSAVAILLSWLGAWYFLRPLRDLQQSFNAIKQGKFDTRLGMQRHDEVGDIIQSFNQLAAWLQGLHQRYEQMNSDLSHELRTPINALQARLEALEDGLVSADNHQFTLMRNELAQLTRIVEDLQLLSLTEANMLKVSLVTANLSQLVEEVVSHYDTRAERQGLSLKTVIEPRIMIKTDKDRLRQVIINLLDNAFKYGADGGQIRISVSRQDQVVLVSVKDFGKGLSETQQSLVFERFYRVEQARQQSHNLGLGLPICRQLVDLMGGTLRLQSAPYKGCNFIICLPLTA